MEISLRLSPKNDLSLTVPKTRDHVVHHGWRPGDSGQTEALEEPGLPSTGMHHKGEQGDEELASLVTFNGL